MNKFLVLALFFTLCGAVTFELPARAEECFEFHAPATTPVSITWEITRGGDLDASLRVLSFVFCKRL